MHGRRNRRQLCSEYFSLTFSSATLRKYIFHHYLMHKLMNKTSRLQQQAIRFSNAQHDTSIPSKSIRRYLPSQESPIDLGTWLLTVNNISIALCTDGHLMQLALDFILEIPFRKDQTFAWPKNMSISLFVVTGISLNFCSYQLHHAGIHKLWIIIYL